MASAKPTKAFKLGDRVTWSSTVRSSRTKKTGTVIEVVAADATPKKLGYRRFDSRSHVSYVVEVIRSSKKTGADLAPLFYWPKVKDLAVANG